MDKTSNKYWTLCIYLTLALATLAVFWQVRNYDFVSFDDWDYVLKNQHINTGLTREGVSRAFTKGHFGNWHPLTSLSHMLDCQLFGTNPGWHHLTNLLLHLINTLLLFAVLKRMTGTLWRSAFVAAAFAIHPLHVESVAWISERKDVLSILFWILTMAAYLRYVRRPGTSRYLLTLLVFAMGLMAKPMLVTLPFVLLLLDYWPLGRFGLGQAVKNANQLNLKTPDTDFQWRLFFRLVWEKVPLFILSAIISVATFFVERSGGVMKTFTGYPLSYRIGNALVTYMRYIGKMLWPSNLAIFYPHPRVDLPVWQIVMALLLLVCITAAVLRRARQNPYLTVGWLWYLITLVPVIGLVQVGLQALADRYTYMPLTGLFIIVAWGIPASFTRLYYRKTLLSLSAIVLLSALGVTAWRQVRHWHNNITLYKHAAAVVRDNWWAHNHLGTAFCRQGMLYEGIKHFTEALRIRPELPELHANLAAPLIKQGKLDEAITHLTEALQIGPDYAPAHFYLGVVLAEQDKPDEAITHFTSALIIKPDFADAHLYLGVQLARLDNLDEAIVHFIETLRIKPDYADAHSNLGYALVHQGNFNEAITHFKETLRVKPDWVEPMNTLAWLLATCEQTKFHSPVEAIQLAERVCELTNDENPSFLDTLAAAYAAAGKFPQAVATAEKALEIAQSSQQEKLAEQIQNRLGLYKAGWPYIESSPKLSPD